MAIVDKPEDLSLDLENKGSSIHLEEDGDVEKENFEYSGVYRHIKDKFERAKTSRQTDEDRWMKSYRNYRGLYGSDVQFTDKEKSQAFVKITKTKVLAAYAQIIDVLFAGSKFPIGIEPRKEATGIENEVHFDPNELTEENIKNATGQDVQITNATTVRPDILERIGGLKTKLEPVSDDLREGQGQTPSAITFEPAQEAARAMETKIHDQLSEANASKHLRSVAFEMCLLGTGIMKGPFAFEKEYPNWDEEGNYAPEFNTIAKTEHTSVWDFYPDPDARHMNDAEYVIERHRYSRSQLRALKNRPMFRKESIELAIDGGSNYSDEYWENVLDENNNNLDTDRYEVLEYWGYLDRDSAEEAELTIPKEFKDMDEVQVNAWICNGHILRLALNPFTPKRIPYHSVPYELNPYSFFGIGVAENMEDTQLLMNGFMRLAVDNAALSSNLLIEIDETNLVPGQTLDVYPGKVFRRQAGAPGQAIFGTKFPNVTGECLQMFDKSRQLADEATGMPSFAHGMTGVQGVGRTASGMSMLMGAAAQSIKAVVRNIDDYLLSPLGKSLFAFNMQFNFDPDIKGDLDVIARGTESLMRNEIRSQRLIQFMQMSANPTMAPFVKYDYILRELAASMDLDEDKILNDPREAAIQAKMMAEIAAMMPQQPPQGEQAVEGNPEAIADPTGTGGGTIAPGNAPEPTADGFTGAGGGANSEPQPQQTTGPVQ